MLCCISVCISHILDRVEKRNHADMRTYMTGLLSPVWTAGVVDATGSIPQRKPHSCLFSFKKIIFAAAGGCASQPLRPSQQR